MAKCAEDTSKLTNPIHEFVTENTDKKLSCNSCGHIFPSNHIGNVRKHLSIKHTKDFEKLNKLYEHYKASRASKSENRQSLQKKQTRDGAVSVAFNVDEVRMGLVEMANVNLCTFRLLQCSGFSRIMGPIIQAFRKQKISISTQPLALREYSVAEYEKMRNIIKEELDGRMFSLMVDSTTTFNRRIIGIVAQYILDDKVVVRTLAMRRYKCNPTAQNYCQIIKSVLFEYGTNVRYVYTVTTDNESAITKCVKDTAVIIQHVLNFYRLFYLD